MSMMKNLRMIFQRMNNSIIKVKVNGEADVIVTIIDINVDVHRSIDKEMLYICTVGNGMTTILKNYFTALDAEKSISTDLSSST